MKRKQLSTLLISTVFASALVFNSCKPKKIDIDLPVKPNKEGSTTGDPATTTEGSTTSGATTSGVIMPVTGCEPSVNKFYAGQHMLAGNITVSNDAVNLFVTFNTVDGWLMKQTQLYVGAKSGLPAGANGNPKIGNFPYKAPHKPMVTSYTYTIPLSSLKGDSCIIIAAHAEVIKVGANGQEYSGETAWGAGKEITPGGSWATYSDYCLCKNTTGTTTSGTTTGGTTTSETTTGGTTTGGTTTGGTTTGETTTGGTTTGGTTTSGSTTEGSTTSTTTAGSTTNDEGGIGGN